MNISKKHRAEVTATMIRLGVPAHDAALVIRHAVTVARLAEKACNEPITLEDNQRDEAAQARIIALLKPHGITVIFDGDPRGFCTRIKKPGLAGNTWGGDEHGYGIA